MNKQEVQEFLIEHDLKPIKRFGQNFLIHLGMIKTIVQSIKKHPSPFVEIGPGCGALTRHFDKNQILLIERDKKIGSYWKNNSWNILQQDALKLKSAQLPKNFTLFGNLPYEIAASLIIKATVEDFPVKTLVFLIQKEVADRIKSSENSKNYSLISVIAQTFWIITPVAHVPKSYFYPAPQVDGSVLEFNLKKQTSDFSALDFFNFVKQCFQFRRKMLFKKLASSQPKQLLEDINLKSTCRAEDLSPQKYMELYLKLRSVI